MGNVADDNRKYDFLLKLHGKNGEKALTMAEAPRLDDGYFGPDSISWKIYNNFLVAGMGALSGLFISVLDPDGGYGVGQHTVYHSDTLGRVRRSVQFFGGAVFGDTAGAEKVGRDLFRKHSHVNGVVPATGESYRANHVETLKFTYVVGWPHLWRAYKAFGDPNATAEDERQFYAEQHIVAELLGIPSGELPRTPEEVDAWVQNAEQNIMAFTRPAQELTDFLTKPPWTPVWPLGVLNIPLRVLIWASVPLLTPHVRAMCGLENKPIRTAVSTALVRRAAKLVSNPIVDRALASWFGYEYWGYMHNAARHAAGTGRVPFTHDPGLRLQQGKGGTLQSTESADARSSATAGHSNGIAQEVGL
ncbi:oxygenase MpaB family protein [Nocardia sp. XZ_19_385]